MSCSVHDAWRLETRGVPTCVVGTEPFADEALEQAAVLGIPDLRAVLLPHPVQLLPPGGVAALADAHLPAILSRLLAG